MANGRKAKGGTSILKRLAGNGDKTERRQITTEPSRRPLRHPEQKPPPQTGRYQRSRMYRGEQAGREQQPKRESKEHREKVEEHKKKHRPGLKEGEYWSL